MKRTNWLNHLPFYEIRTTLPQFSEVLRRHWVRHKMCNITKYLYKIFNQLISNMWKTKPVVLLSLFSGKTDPWTRESMYPRQLQRPGTWPGTWPGTHQLGLVNTDTLSPVNTDSFGEDARWEFVEKLIPDKCIPSFTLNGTFVGKFSSSKLHRRLPLLFFFF